MIVRENHYQSRPNKLFTPRPIPNAMGHHFGERKGLLLCTYGGCGVTFRQHQADPQECQAEVKGER